MNKEKCELLSKKECAFLRGFAILAISLHNLCHCLPNAPQENEFWYSESNNLILWNNLEIEHAFIQIFAFWGHLGVPIFVFLSGYGLAIKYNNTIKDNWKQFVYLHYKKLIIPMLIGTVIYQILIFFLSQKNSDLIHLILQISLIQNLLPHNMSVFSPGPYWYFGMTQQLYILYIFIHRKSFWHLILLSFIIFLIQSFLQNHYLSLVWIKYNCIGWFFPFAMGIILARKPLNLSYSKSYYLFTLPISIILTLIFGFQYHLWLLIPIIIPIFAICFVKVTPSLIQKPLIMTGHISLYIFVVHPIVRQLAITFAQNINPYLCLLIYIILTILIACVMKKIVVLIKGYFV